jgi:predicted RNase H-like HicB family nuclease
MKTIEEAEDQKKELHALGIEDPIYLLTQETIEKAKMLRFERKCEKASRLIKGDHRLLWWESRMC